MADLSDDRTKDLSGSAPTLRVADPLDRDAIGALYRELLATHGDLDERYRGITPSDLRAAIMTRLDAEDARFWVAVVGKKAVAFCGAEIERADALVENVRGRIDELYVAPPWRRSGLGRRLVAQGLAWCGERGATRVSVRVLTANQEAQRFWQAMDFASVVDVRERRV